MTNINNFFNEYVGNLNNSILETDIEKLNLAAEEIIKTIKKKRNNLCLWKWWFSSNFKPLYL